MKQYLLIEAILLVFILGGCDKIDLKQEAQSTMEQAQTTGIDRANELVRRFGTRLGHVDAKLDADLDRSFGEVGFRFDPDRNVLIGRVYVGKVRARTASAEGRKNIETNLRALNDPAIGGMFDRGGGFFLLDREREMMFLVKEFPVDDTNEAVFVRDMETQMNLAAAWLMRWSRHVIRIAHGREPAPTEFVTLANDPYRR